MITASATTPITNVEVSIKSETDILDARLKIREMVIENLNFPPLYRMHTLTAVSELTRNIYKYAGIGKVIANITKSNTGKKGIKIQFIDNGPGIPNIEKAMQPKPVTQYHIGMGLGLIGSRNLADEFDIKSKVGNGTTITWIKWER